ncbi:hypothetical protein AAC03_24690, partial [Salmonella enterica subsp. enterica serovar Typhimurium]|nr:hypothetical protein [Salmonella enterica subsp. enterica serovar Typhimurium]
MFLMSYQQVEVYQKIQLILVQHTLKAMCSTFSRKTSSFILNINSEGGYMILTIAEKPELAEIIAKAFG